MRTAFLTAAAAAETTNQIFFEPAKFIGSLRYMGIGMLVIFVIIGVIILATLLLNRIFAHSNHK